MDDEPHPASESTTPVSDPMTEAVTIGWPPVGLNQYVPVPSQASTRRILIQAFVGSFTASSFSTVLVLLRADRAGCLLAIVMLVGFANAYYRDRRLAHVQQANALVRGYLVGQVGCLIASVVVNWTYENAYWLARQRFEW
jgi:hypothetical protein